MFSGSVFTQTQPTARYQSRSAPDMEWRHNFLDSDDWSNQFLPVEDIIGVEPTPENQDLFDPTTLLN
jgi:hypothetical protein